MNKIILKTRPSSPAVTQEEHKESSLPPIKTLDEISTVLTFEIDNTSLIKKLKQTDHRNLVSTDIQIYNKNNVGLFVNKDNVSTAEIYPMLTDSWTPSSTYKFLQVNVHQRIRSFKRRWSAYDPAKNPLSQLVLKPLTSSYNAYHYIQTHEKTDYHSFSKE
ncbi:unnamed protein product [Rotaria sordida]|uniref:Uncharacterized protein n=1 Tax=Rotaria sordida TaxID=392033 RepID=A0A815RFT7_9BILA|nr:unnamed protein product [Rotaria sordida]CAF4142756.1 unnamed protein product [Rotaria sordida]